MVKNSLKKNQNVKILAEIRAKQQAFEELRLLRQRYDEMERELTDSKRKIRKQKDDLSRLERSVVSYSTNR